MVEHHGPPEANMPGQPRDARRTDVISLVLRPIGAPRSVRGLMHVQPRTSGEPQALLGGESVEVEVGKLPRRFELPDQIATGFVGHGRSHVSDGLSARRSSFSMRSGRSKNAFVIW